jgi:hypothetical protein
MSKLITVCLVIVGLINFVPVLAIISVQKLEEAYSISLISRDLIILMKHRALLFGILGGFILYSAFVPVHQRPAVIMAAISMIGYVVLMHFVGGYNESLYKVLIFDYIGLVFLALIVVLKYFVKANKQSQM